MYGFNEMHSLVVVCKCGKFRSTQPAHILYMSHVSVYIHCIIMQLKVLDTYASMKKQILVELNIPRKH